MRLHIVVQVNCKRVLDAGTLDHLTKVDVEEENLLIVWLRGVGIDLVPFSELIIQVVADPSEVRAKRPFWLVDSKHSSDGDLLARVALVGVVLDAVDLRTSQLIAEAVFLQTSWARRHSDDSIVPNDDLVVSDECLDSDSLVAECPVVV